MNSTFCLDANVLIQAWQKYYSPKFCPDYWNVLKLLGEQKRLFLPSLVAEEILKTDDDLSKWISGSQIPIYKADSTVTEYITQIFNTDPLHQRLVDSTRGRSLADPWLIAHAMKEKACVVTKEELIITPTNKIKIPNVCEKMGVRWINDFQMIDEIGIRFSCFIQL